MNDYWNYLAHGELGKERKGHKYYARVAVGRNKLGFTQYRYFYDAREYGAYMTRQKNNRYSPKFEGKKNTTYFVTGKGPSMVDGGTANKDIQRAKGLGVYTTHYLSNEKGTPTGATATSEAKTVKDHPNLRKVKQSIKTAVKKGKNFVSGLVTDDTKITMLSDMDGKSIKKYVSGKKKGKNFVSSLFSDNTKITMLRDMDGKSVKKYIAGKK